MYRLLSDTYGQLRGYGRWRIRRTVRRNAALCPEALAGLTERLFQQRARNAVRDFEPYADMVKNVGGEPVRAHALPVWTRDDQRRLFASLDAPPIRGSFVNATGGSTGTPVQYYVTRPSWEWRTAVSDRGYSWAGAEEGRRSFYVWGTPVYSPARQKRVVQFLHHKLQRRTFFDSFHFGHEQKERCCREINCIRPLALVGYAGNLVDLARHVREHRKALKWRAGTLVTAAEGVQPGQRALLKEFLADEVLMSYGSREFMLIGMECKQHRGYHVASDNLLVEVVDDEGNSLPPGESGRIVVTDLRNDANPFVRYEIGDVGVMGDPCEHCPCGLPFPLLKKVEGRTQEFVELPAGERLTALFIPHLMKEFNWVEGYQVVQRDRANICMRLVTRARINPELVGPLEAALREKVGAEVAIDFEEVNALTRNHSGKTPVVLTESGRT